ncbi:MAG: hypothetical protein ACD_16C00212G0005 [uncultured bacterium]|nr:MAG: hypothetical protein ACD_16C00212G0005 [uncultured bacterium]OFW70073.1 MAG: hypothetical protein A2X70_02705 [Alphaproteobacteria bacterium GWC2_42_16]OFW74573.1 MAG: hypothetical protein A2Z80_04100 [Alphaproteobacteria bacterium GWA2_41_27]OFW84845.1 MAG: hypothetical protein A3E50_02295 [Alphaproteobacteria bacterium RIFCSPHIGHO2_12_FULL_42_100]OFW86570.1 MAG: hypothetical protein A2W06_06950 [Alphaproteobacteria bacterium RBG_16_42_14]OFW90967.1 MAG: hypothetical protein A2W46_071
MRKKLKLSLLVSLLFLPHALCAEDGPQGFIFPLKPLHEYKGPLDQRLTGEMNSFINEPRGDTSAGCSSCRGS